MPLSYIVGKRKKREEEEIHGLKTSFPRIGEKRKERERP